MARFCKVQVLAPVVINILLCNLAITSSENTEKQNVEDLIARILPDRTKEFSIVIDKEYFDDENVVHLDSFEFHTVNKSILQITATSGVAAAWGFNHYLKYFCNAHISWSGSQLNVSKTLPAVSKPVKVSSPNRYRYYQNVCTSSYSFVWWNWSRWEKEIDWMALNGINLPLAFTAQEEIFRRVYKELGVTQNELDEHFAGPAFLAWGRMGNMRGWGGPLPYPSWYNNQLALQHKILKRMRGFGMKPVLPGFAGHIPPAIMKLHPDAKIMRLGDWGKFNSTYCCTYFLDPSDPLFHKIGSMFINEQMKEYNGTDHIYNADSFNEMTPPSSDPAYLASSSHSVLEAMQAADPDAIWLMQGWLFQDRAFWKQTQIKALLTGVPVGKMIILDLFAEVQPIWKETESFYGQPFIWCMLHNFGGNLGLYGKVEEVTSGSIEAHSTKGSTIIGTGMAPEGIEQNDFIYDLMSEMGWRSTKFDVYDWTDAYAERRYGLKDKRTQAAWKILLSTVYNCSDTHSDHNHGIPVTRPTSINLKYAIWYNIKDLISAWKLLLDASDEFQQSETYRYDLVDVGRQVLQDISYSIYMDIIQAYKDSDLVHARNSTSALLGLLNDADELLSSDKHFLLGRWLESAKSLGKTSAEKSLYEFNARNQITMWGPDDNIKDYANKMWGGLMHGYYRKRWDIFCDTILTTVAHKLPIDIKKLTSNVKEFERNWNHMLDSYPVEPSGDVVAISKHLYAKYGNSAFVWLPQHTEYRDNGSWREDYSGRSYSIF
ncbi:alpha-N-acetylglucosaminidase-like isoform X1 [Rhopilema esculentum]|uniref:alpha-N-acetylglucosaminidase-like isoform X1 n=2 Tax=Rhopilema esculentum TaxID=499914 RepID=UPI0031DA922A